VLLGKHARFYQLSFFFIFFIFYISARFFYTQDFFYISAPLSHNVLTLLVDLYYHLTSNN